jgi:hypothetical protein
MAAVKAPRARNAFLLALALCALGACIAIPIWLALSETRPTRGTRPAPPGDQTPPSPSTVGDPTVPSPAPPASAVGDLIASPSPPTPGVASPADASPADEGEWTHGASLPQASRYVGHCAELDERVLTSGVVRNEDNRFNSLFRVVSVTDPSRRLYFPSTLMWRDQCASAPAGPAYPAFYTRESKYATSVENAYGRPGCAAWPEMQTAVAAQRACDGASWCAGYYATADAKRFVLSVAPPGQCTADWKPVANSGKDVCARFAGPGYKTGARGLCEKCDGVFCDLLAHPYSTSGSGCKPGYSIQALVGDTDMCVATAAEIERVASRTRV